MRDAAAYRDLINRSLEPRLRSLGAIPERLLEAMLYSLTAGGKRLRPVLLLAACAPKEGEFAEPRFRKVEHRLHDPPRQGRGRSSTERAPAPPDRLVGPSLGRGRVLRG